MFRLSRYIILNLLSLMLLATVIGAQDFRATVTGRITDANRAAIPGAQVHVKNIGTNDVTTMTTDSEGNYRFLSLSPGHYSLSAELQGMGKVQRTADVTVGKRKVRAQARRLHPGKPVQPGSTRIADRRQVKTNTCNRRR